MKRQSYRNRGRRIVLGAALVALGGWPFRMPWGVAGQDIADGGRPLPEERQSQTGDSSRRVDQAEDIIAMLHEGNRMEIEGAKLALERGHAERVKSYAGLLMMEHEHCDKQLMAYAAQKGLDPRRFEDGGPQATDGPIERLRLRHPQNFDRAFILAMVREHGKMVDALASTMRESRDTDLRRLLGGQRPVLDKLKKAGEAILARLPANSAD
jgi:predicted outer membrane protein